LDVDTFTEWLLDLILRAPMPLIRDVQPVVGRNLVNAIEVTLPGPANPSIDKVFRVRVEEVA
jgi:hypothetical protein